MNQPSTIDLVSQIAVPTATLIVSLVALAVAAFSYRLSRGTRREEKARAGRAERLELLRSIELSTHRRWESAARVEKSNQQFYESVEAFDRSSEVNAQVVADYLEQLNSAMLPPRNAPDEYTDVDGKSIAVAVVSAWVNDPFDLRAVKRAWQRKVQRGTNAKQLAGRGR